jgi:hypothetical protein
LEEKPVVITFHKPGNIFRGVHLGFVAGVITRERLPAFEKMLWRACRGNVFLRQAEIEDPLEDPQIGGSVRKSVFLLFFQVTIKLDCVMVLRLLFFSKYYTFPTEQTNNISVSLTRVSN